MAKRTGHSTIDRAFEQMINPALQIFCILESKKNGNGKSIFRPFRNFPFLQQESFTTNDLLHHLIDGKYKDLDAFRVDIELLVGNAQRFYTENSEEYVDAKEIMNVFRQVKPIVLTEVTDYNPKRQKLASYSVSAEDALTLSYVANVVQEMLDLLFTSVYKYQNEGVQLSKLMAEHLSNCDNVVGNHVTDDIPAISFELMKKRLENGEYKRLTTFQTDLFRLFSRVRDVSQVGTEIFNSTLELQKFYIIERDKLCCNGNLLLSPAILYTIPDLEDSVYLNYESDDAKNDMRKEWPPIGQNSSKNVIDPRKSCHHKENYVYYQQFKVSDDITLKTGDCVSIENLPENPSQKFILRIHCIFTNTKGDALLYGSKFLFRADVALPCDGDDVLYKQEVYLSDEKITISVSQIGDKCAVLQRSEYISCRPTEIPESKVYICQSMLSKSDDHISELPENELRKFLHDSSVIKDEIYFFHSTNSINGAASSNTSATLIEAESHISNHSKEMHTFHWNSLINIKQSLTSKKDTCDQRQQSHSTEKLTTEYIRYLLYDAFVRSEESGPIIGTIFNDLTSFAEKHCLRFPSKPVIDILYLLMKSRHETKIGKEVCKITCNENKFNVLNDYPLKVPEYVSKPNPEGIYGYQPIIFTTEIRFSESLGEKIWVIPPHDEDNITKSSDSTNSVPYNVQRELCYKLMSLGHAWTEIVMGVEPNSNYMKPKISSQIRLDDPTSTGNRRNASGGSSRNGSGANSRNGSGANSRNASGDSNSSKNLMACQLAEQTVIDDDTPGIVISSGDRLIIDTFIVCQNLELCRYLSTTFGIVHLDEILLNFQNKKGNEAQKRQFFHFNQEDINGTIKNWWRDILKPQPGQKKTFRMIQSRFNEYLARGCHNIAITCCVDVVENVTANSYGLISKPNIIYPKNVEKFSCVTSYSTENLFLSGVASLTRIINRSLKFNASFPITVRFDQKYHEVEISLLAIIPFYVLRRISVQKIEKALEITFETHAKKLDPLLL